MIQAIANAGYSPNTFGIAKNEGRVPAGESGTALKIKEAKSYKTTAKKAEYWRIKLQDILSLMLQVDALFCHSGITPMAVNVEMRDGTQSSMIDIAGSLLQIQQAQAASTETRVSWLHPDWDRQQVDTEVQRIQSESGAAVPDPMQSGGLD
jgi:hypothetical protein